MSSKSSSRSASPTALTIGGVIAMAAALGIGRFIYTPILPLMVEDLALSQSQAGLIASANFAGYLAGALMAATPKLRGSRRAWFLGALAASAATTALMAAGDTIFFFCVVRFVAGVASAYVLVMMSSLVFERLTQDGRPGLASANFGGVGVGMVVSSILMLALSAYHVGWRSAWLAAGAICIAALAATAFLIPGREGDGAPASQTSDDGFAPGFQKLVISYALFGFGYVITATFLVALARMSAATRPLEPYAWMIVGLAGAPSVALWSWLGGRLGVFRAYALACVVEAIGVAASVLWLNAVGVIIAAIFLGGTIMGITALGLAGARTLCRSDPRRAFALMTAAFGVGQIIGPTVGGLAFDLTGSFLTPSLAAAAALILAAMLALAAAPRAAD